MIGVLLELAAFLWFLQCGPAPCAESPRRPASPSVIPMTVIADTEAP